jgi:hypothetical protein
MKPEFEYTKQNLQKLSDLKLEIGLHEFQEVRKDNRTAHFTILLLKFVGEYRIGSDGQPDALYMQAMTAACLEIWYCDAVIFDFTELSYEWGNDLANTIVFPLDRKGKEFPACIVPGPSERALNGLLLFFVSHFPKDFKIFHPTRDEATRYIKQRLHDSNKPSKWL